MPELIEVEVYRQHAERALGRTMAGVVAPDAWFLKGGLTASDADSALRGRKFTGARRIGKLLLLDTDGGTGPVLGLRFGMTGRLLVDAMAPIAELEYGSTRDVEAWDRFAVTFAEGGDIRLRDPRRLGGVVLDPDVSRLGVDARSITRAQLRAALDRSIAPLKARLMDQSRVAGLGNLLTDEMLWRAGLDPAREARSLTPAEQRRLHRHVRTTLEDLIARGGSHTGDLQHARTRGGRCPRDGTPLERRRVGGRTTYSCPRHQR
jgi:formamidopyrimidine-DNA glycosylase